VQPIATASAIWPQPGWPLGRNPVGHLAAHHRGAAAASAPQESWLDAVARLMSQ
jgi:hypothetical protein